MNKKIKKIMYLTGFISISTLSLQKIQYENKVINHFSNDIIHDGNVISHRGLSSIHVENSLKAICEGFDCDCSDGVEIDVRLTKDDKVIVAHNPYIIGIGELAEKTLSEIEEKDYKNNNLTFLSLYKQVITGKDGKLIYDRYHNNKKNKETIVTLNKVVSEIDDSEKELLIDLKFNNEKSDILMDKINDIFKDYSGKLNITFQSFSYDNLSKMMKKYPEYDYQLIISKEKNLKYLNSEFKKFCIKSDLLDRKLVEEELEKENKISAWTINSYKDYKKLYKEIGSYITEISIITDYPDEMCYLNNKSNTKVLKK